MTQDMLLFLSSLRQHLPLACLELVEILLPQPPVMLGFQVCKLSQQLIFFSESKTNKEPTWYIVYISLEK